MYYKKFPNTDMTVSAVGMGVMRFPDEDIRENRLEKCAELMLYAHDKGINYFDTAPRYCEGKSEAICGIAFSQLKRDSFYAASKTSYMVLDRPVTEQQFFRRLEKTLEDMKLDYLDFYLLWGIVAPEYYRRQRDELMGFFEKAKAQGLVKHLGISSHMEGQELFLPLEDGYFEGLQIGYNAYNYRYRIQGVEEAHKRGVGVMVMNPLGGGQIPANPQYFSYLTKGTDLTVPQAAMRFVISQKEITVALGGFATKEHVDDAVKAAQGLVELPAREYTAPFAQRDDELTGLCTGCNYCVGCPVDIPIPKYMDLYNHKIFGGNIALRSGIHWGIKEMAAGDCIACGACEEKCTQHLPIIERLRELASLSIEVPEWALKNL